MNIALFFQAKQIRHWMYPCIMCLQNFEKKSELEHFMCANHIYMDATPEEVNLLGMFHTLLHTDERNLKMAIFMLSVQFLHKLYRMCNITQGYRTKQIMTAVEEVLHERYVILQLFKKKMTIEKKLITRSVFAVPVLLFDFFSMFVEVVVDEVVGLVLLAEVQVVVVDGSYVEGVQVQP